MSSAKFSGKTILVTGAGAGIGKAITQKLVEEGAQVIAVSLLQDELVDLAKELPGIRTIQVDLRDWQGTRKALEGLGKVDGLVNNAGVAALSSFMNITEKDFDLTFDVNVKAIINVSQIIAKSMVENDIKGSIVNTSSIAAMTTIGGMTVYCASKGAVQAITKMMALELGSKGIRVNSVNPGVVETELARPLWDNSAIHEFILKRTPMGKFATTQDIANAVAFLLSDDAAMVNGIPLIVDGGYMAC